jgi:hypothetical protein
MKKEKQMPRWPRTCIEIDPAIMRGLKIHCIRHATSVKQVINKELNRFKEEQA